ncbi:MAG: AIR synthase [Firmicutes bacterium]|nr:AIR synthase [Bacillota bacterium]
MSGLRAGKLAPEKLRQLVLAHRGRLRPEVRVHAGLGEDSAVAETGGRLLVVSSDPITGASAEMGRIGVYVACNDVAAMGAEPLGIQVVLLMPEGTPDEAIAGIMAQVAAAADHLGIEVLGGHTEITGKVSAPIVVLTAIGLVEPDRLVTSAGARPGDGLLVTKPVGLEGTAILAADRAQELAAALPGDLLERARSFIAEVDAVQDGRLTAALGVSAMHDVTEGGLVGAAWEMAQASGVGVEIWEARVPVRLETQRICRHFGIDPLRLISSGAMLAAARDPERVVRALREAGREAAVVGQVLPASEGVRVVRADGRRDRVTGAPPDELWRVLAS